MAGKSGPFPAQRSSVQVNRVVANLRLRIGRMLSACGPANLDPLEVWEEMKSKKISYEGEEIGTPHPLTLEQVQKSVPPPGHGASVDLAPLLAGRARFLVENPAECLLSREERAEGPNRARVHIQKDDELGVWGFLFEGCS